MPDQTAEVNRWLRAIENARFGVWDLDPHLELVHYSPGWKAHLGYPRVHAPDTTEFWRCRVHPDDLASMQAALRLHLDGQTSSYEMRFRLRSNGSGYRTVLSRGRVVERDAGGNASRMLGTMVDLTERPVTAASHGLASEDPEQTIELARWPLHAALGVACPRTLVVGSAREGAGVVDAAQESQRLVALVSDLLDMALYEATTAA
jgi:hypothetical protein